jgi:hypothetical protein
MDPYVTVLSIIIISTQNKQQSRDSIINIATEGLEFQSWKDQEFSLLHVVQTGSGVHPTSYPMGTRGSFPGIKAAIA